MGSPEPRISRVRKSWRVRVSGHSPHYFADSQYGGTGEALDAAKRWRDERWNGEPAYVQKLTRAQRQEIRESTENYREIAARYGIAPNYVHQIRKS